MTTKSQISKKEMKLKERVTYLKKEVNRYRKGFEILSEYFDSISDEEQVIVYKKLTKLGIF